MQAIPEYQRNYAWYRPSRPGQEGGGGGGASEARLISTLRLVIQIRAPLSL